jgi:hypothetical protein
MDKKKDDKKNKRKNRNEDPVSKRFRDPITQPRTRNYFQIGKFNAKGPATIIKLEDSDWEGIEWKNVRVFFRPNEAQLHALRVKPSETTIYGPKMKVFAVPPAPEQWEREMDRKRKELKMGEQELSIDIELFIEDLPGKRWSPYGSVVYLFGNDGATQTLAPTTNNPPPCPFSRRNELSVYNSNLLQSSQTEVLLHCMFAILFCNLVLGTAWSFARRPNF